MISEETFGASRRAPVPLICSREYSMTRHVLFKIAALMVATAAIGATPAYAESSTAQITVLYDAFGKTSTRRDLGRRPGGEGNLVGDRHARRHCSRCRVQS